MSVRSTAKLNASLGQVDPIWHSIRAEAEEAAKSDPVLGTFLYATILNQPSLEDAVMHRISERLGHADLSADILRQTFDAMLDANPEWSQTVRVDIQAVYDRDPAYSRFMDPILYLKGFHAIQTHRLAHWLYHQGRRDFAYYLQRR
jgi:serine O-acetyltransferase